MQAPQRTFNAVRDELLRDSQHRPTIGPVQPTREYLRAMDHKQLVFERVDADGIGHPLALEGDTHEGWSARDLVAKLRRGAAS